MLAKELCTKDFPVVKTSDPVGLVLKLMDEYKIEHLPIVNNKQLLGVISESDILAINDQNSPVGDVKLSVQNAYVVDEQHIYEVVKTAVYYELTIIPVVDLKKNYCGSITLKALTKGISEVISVMNPGGIIMLELNVKDYSLSHISQIVESNNAHILSSYVKSHFDSTKMLLTLKINKQDLTSIIKTFNRFDYTITASYHEDKYFEDLKRRFDEFMKYLNI